MKKILASLAVLALASQAHADFEKGTKELKDTGAAIKSSYEGMTGPLKPVVGTFVTPLGDTVMYIADGLDILKQEGWDATIAAAYSSGQCLENSVGQQPGIATGCFIKFGGDASVMIINTAGYSIAQFGDYAGGLTTDILAVWSAAAGSLEAHLAESGIPLLPQGVHVIKFVIDASGMVIGETVHVVTGTLRATTQGVALTVINVIDVPVALLAGDLGRAAGSMGVALGTATCTAVDLVLAPVRLAAGLVNLVKDSPIAVPSCLADIKARAESIRNGTSESHSFVPEYGHD